MQKEEKVGELKGMSATDVIEGVQLGQLGALEDAASNHTAFVSKVGFKKGAHFALNGKLSSFQGQQQVRNISGTAPCPPRCPEEVSAELLHVVTAGAACDNCLPQMLL